MSFGFWPSFVSGSATQGLPGGLLAIMSVIYQSCTLAF